MIRDNTNDASLSNTAQTSDKPQKETADKQPASILSGHRPIIGIPVPIQQGNQGPLLLADAVGTWAVERMQGRVFLIPLWPFPTHKHVYQSLWSLVQSMDGLLLPAGIQGTDWYTHWREREKQSGPQNWPIAWEIALAQLATYIGMPILAIADGAEKWNLALGGTREDSATESPHTSSTAPDTWDRQRIRVRSQSKLATALRSALSTPDDAQKPWELAFMPHQQGIKKFAPGLRSCAQSEDESIVAFERQDPAFGLGIIGRLDWGLDHVYGTALFDAFLSASRSFATVRQQNETFETSREIICTTLYDLVTHHQSLIAIPPSPSLGRNQHSGPLASSLSPLLDSTASSIGKQERLRQRSQQPTKEELNRIRRQRLKMMTR